MRRRRARVWTSHVWDPLIGALRVNRPFAAQLRHNCIELSTSCMTFVADTELLTRKRIIECLYHWMLCETLVLTTSRETREKRMQLLNGICAATSKVDAGKVLHVKCPSRNGCDSRSCLKDLSPLVPDDDADTMPTSTSSSPASAPARGEYLICSLRALSCREKAHAACWSHHSQAHLLPCSLSCYWRSFSPAYLPHATSTAPSWHSRRRTSRTVRSSGRLLWQRRYRWITRRASDTARESVASSAVCSARLQQSAPPRLAPKPEQSAAGCRCLHIDLLCDRKAHCRNDSDEWPVMCAH